MATDNCCDDPKSPMHNFRKGRRKIGIELMDFPNPIPAEITDADDLSKLLEKWKFVPYAGMNKHTGHSLLLWYLMLAKLSPTHGACIRKRIQYAIGGKVIFTRSTDPDFEIGEDRQEMSVAEKTRYREAIKTFIEFDGGIRRIIRRAGWQFETNGNAFVELSVARVLDQVRFNIRLHPTTNVMFRKTDAGEPRAVGISPIWTESYLRKNPPRFLPVTENFDAPVWITENGVNKTVFHLKAGSNTWYGRPQSESEDLYKYREVQDALYLVKQSAANFVGQLIIEIEDDDPETAPATNETEAAEAGFNSFADRMEQNFTQKGDDPQSVLVTSRPYGSRPMLVHQVKPNTNQDWYKVTGEIAELKILRAHSCTLRFMGFEAANGFATDVFVGDYVMNMEPVINAFREEITTFFNSILNVCWRVIGNDEFINFAIDFASPIQSAIEQYKTTSAQPQQQQPDPQQPDPQQSNQPQNTPGPSPGGQ